jgi:hypothetical protein
MECNDKFIRQMLSSPYGQTIGAAILDRLDGANTVTILLADGSKIRLETREEALRVLGDYFGWRPAAAEC